MLLIWIAYKLLNEDSEAHDFREAHSFGDAVRTIILADVVMSLDNMLAVGGAAHGSIELLLFGLALSMPLIMFGSSMIARLLNRVPSLMIIGVVVLAVTAARMIADDHIVHSRIDESLHLPLLVGLSIAINLVVLLPTFVRWRRSLRERHETGLSRAERRTLPE